MIEIQPLKKIILPHKIEIEDIEEILINKGTQNQKIACLRLQVKTEDLRLLMQEGKPSELKILYIYEDLTSALCNFHLSYIDMVKHNVFYIHIVRSYRTPEPDEAMPWIRDLQMKSVLED
jgi:hypothetical protein